MVLLPTDVWSQVRHAHEDAEDITGGDGLVAARHLYQYGYNPSVYYPKEGKHELYQVSQFL